MEVLIVQAEEKAGKSCTVLYWSVLCSMDQKATVGRESGLGVCGQTQ